MSSSASPRTPYSPPRAPTHRSDSRVARVSSTRSADTESKDVVLVSSTKRGPPATNYAISTTISKGDGATPEAEWAASALCSSCPDGDAGSPLREFSLPPTSPLGGAASPEPSGSPAAAMAQVEEAKPSPAVASEGDEEKFVVVVAAEKPPKEPENTVEVVDREQFAPRIRDPPPLADLFGKRVVKAPASASWTKGPGHAHWDPAAPLRAQSSPDLSKLRSAASSAKSPPAGSPNAAPTTAETIPLALFSGFGKAKPAGKVSAWAAAPAHRDPFGGARLVSTSESSSKRQVVVKSGAKPTGEAAKVQAARAAELAAPKRRVAKPAAKAVGPTPTAKKSMPPPT